MSHKHMSLREGKVYIDGIEVLNQVSCKINFIPEIALSKVLGDKGVSRRWVGRDITGELIEYKSTPWLIDMVKNYEQNGKTPKFQLIAAHTDSESDFCSGNNTTLVTCIDCVLTGEIPLISLDSGGELVKDKVSFGAYEIV